MLGVIDDAGVGSTVRVSTLSVPLIDEVLTGALEVRLEETALDVVAMLDAVPVAATSVLRDKDVDVMMLELKLELEGHVVSLPNCRR